MTTVGDVLGLAHTARDRLTTLRATAWHWGHTARSERAWQRFRVRRGGGGVRFTRGDGPPPETSEYVVHLWVEGRTRSRLERPMPFLGDDALALTVIDGDRRWSFMPGGRAVEGSSGGEFAGFEFEWMVDPTELLAKHRLESTGPLEVDGRPAHGLHATPREEWHTFFPGPALLGDDYGIAIDAELGIVLRMTSRIDGQPFSIIELRDVAVGIELPPATFVFNPPAGERIVRIPPPGHSVSDRTWFTPGEVAAAAPFPILVPRGVPADRGRATLVGGDWPTPTPFVAYLFYDLPPALDLVERAVADAEPVEDWEPVDVGGLTAMVRRRRARHPAGRHEVRVVRDGTEVRLNSDLELERLLQIAASLERVRPAE